MWQLRTQSVPDSHASLDFSGFFTDQRSPDSNFSYFPKYPKRLVLYGKPGVKWLAQMFSNLGLAIKRLGFHLQASKAAFWGGFCCSICICCSRCRLQLPIGAAGLVLSTHKCWLLNLEVWGWMNSHSYWPLLTLLPNVNVLWLNRRGCSQSLERIEVGGLWLLGCGSHR